MLPPTPAPSTTRANIFSSGNVRETHIVSATLAVLNWLICSISSGGRGVPVVLIRGNTVTFEDWQLSGVSAKAKGAFG
jgi:hypothetical protein